MRAGLPIFEVTRIVHMFSDAYDIAEGFLMSARVSGLEGSCPVWGVSC